MMCNKTDMGSDHDNYLCMTIEAGPMKRRILLLIRSIDVLLNGYFKHLIGLHNTFKYRVQSRDKKKQYRHPPILYNLMKWKQNTIRKINTNGICWLKLE